MKTPEEIQEFLNSNDLVLEDMDSSQSFKTNLYLITSNFKKIVVYSTNLLSFVKNLYQTFDVSNIVNLVLNNIATSKNVLDINVSLLDGQSITQDIGTKRYRLTRSDNFKVIITADNFLNWITDGLMIQVKTIDGMLVYPTIVTIDNKIEIYFNDMIGSNYKIYWI